MKRERCNLFKDNRGVKGDKMKNVCLIRYDMEAEWQQGLDLFFENLIKLHKENAIPASFFFTGKLLETKTELIKSFYNEVKDCSLFDIQNHSYSHVGLGYEAGKPLEVLETDYQKSFKIHESVLGIQPTAISMCGTGDNGDRLKGFDQSPKARSEFEMLAGFGIKAVNSFLSDFDESKNFVNYSSLGYPEIMGYPSDFSDTSWLWNQDYATALEYILKVIEDRGTKQEHMPIVLHDWVTWTCNNSGKFDHVLKIVERARVMGFELLNVMGCYEKPELWKQVETKSKV
jgi:peptidoglycan/xylan/chitin deacetylase (PgdA/CDA1 family)